ncbi:phenylacetate--CoA ligase [Phaeovibrio sulfidiphilus]|uniref:Phenylacetate-coenzyme A ligase n=1 Tax=Phaeovibrio sulfidiphilus TaxID=1220600 RepID=A0A8J7CDK5_9PROT|nr:phenylacetate--CoA ligase [Phaeovibrio sulfidiphilus]MBE1237833.1 phenylacetate--CoA ligase [Phaeovibrio sulfidiphilus]
MTTTPMFEREMETLSRDALRELQFTRLQDVLRRVYENVPHYRASFDAAGVTPADLRSLDDISVFPFTTKNDMRLAYPFGLFAVPRSQVVRLHTSSGTTGHPTVVGHTKTDLDLWARMMARCYVACGVEPGQIFHITFGYGMFTGGLGYHYGAEHLGCTVVPMGGGNTEKQILLLRDFEADVIAGTPSYLLNLAEEAERRGVDLRSGSLRTAFCGAEFWSQAIRDEIETRLGVTAYDLYGLSEIIGPGVAGECRERTGMHAWEDHFLLEVIDPETMEVLPPGEEGELVITNLTREAIPLIRYRTRDITRLEVEPCACGRTHARIHRVTGRNDDMMIIRGVNVFPSQIETVMLGRPGLSPNYQLVLQREGNLDALTVEVEASPGVETTEYGDMAKQLQHSIKSMIGVTTRVVVLAPGQLPRSVGKAQRVRDLRRLD